MLLVVDFSDLDLDFSQADIRLSDTPDFTVGKLLGKLCDGIEELGGIPIPNRVALSLLGSNRSPLDFARKVKDISLDDWDTIYVTKRR